MVDITVSVDPIGIVNYVTYYSVSGVANRSIRLNTTLNLSSAILSPTLLLGIKTESSFFSAIADLTVLSPTVRAFIGPSSIQTPKIIGNTRPSGSSLDRKQTIPLRKLNQLEVQNSFAVLKQNLEIDKNISKEIKKIYSNTVTTSINNVSSNRNIISNLVNNYNTSNTIPPQVSLNRRTRR